MIEGRRMTRRFGTQALRPHAEGLATLLGSKASVDQVMDELRRFVNDYGIGLEEARRAVLVLHGIPPGLAGPNKRRFTWQTEIDAFS
jgi:hypothetical protein